MLSKKQTQNKAKQILWSDVKLTLKHWLASSGTLGLLLSEIAMCWWSLGWQNQTQKTILEREAQTELRAVTTTCAIILRESSGVLGYFKSEQIIKSSKYCFRHSSLSGGNQQHKHVVLVWIVCWLLRLSAQQGPGGLLSLHSYSSFPFNLWIFNEEKSKFWTLGFKSHSFVIVVHLKVRPLTRYRKASIKKLN